MSTYKGTITLTSIPSSSAENYHVDLSHENIYRYYQDSLLTFSPETVTLKLNKIDADGSARIPTTDYYLSVEIANKPYPHIFDLLSRLTGEQADTGNSENLLTAIVTINADNIVIDFRKIYEYLVAPTGSNTAEDVAAYNELIRIFMQDDAVLLFKIYKPQTGTHTPPITDLLAVHPITLSFGTSASMAKFAITGAAIQAAVNNSKLVFNAEGLSIQNGGFRIFDKDNQNIFSYTEENGLYLKGNGEFTGTINATAGSFSGTVEASHLSAQSGLIGGFQILADKLISTAQINNEPAIELQGVNGNIIANQIVLGDGATIKNRIKLGDAYIYNPAVNPNHLFIDAGEIELTDKGTMRLGAIQVNGATSTISGTNFSITPDTAQFHNIIASGKISTAVFETGHTQAVGGSMLFKPSYKVMAVNGAVLTLDKAYEGATDNYVYLIGENGAVSAAPFKVESKSALTVTLETTPLITPFALVHIGTANDLVVGINSDNTANGMLKPRGITISEFSPDTPNAESNLKVFIGDLKTSGVAGVDGFGLYSQNVYLTGSLTTRMSGSTPTYAGINTLSGIANSVFGIGDTSKIVFWAGSQDTSPESIQAAPFQVTEKGSLYAAQGIFEGSLISESTIYGSDIYAARIHGTGRAENQNYGLAFFDVDNGIVFKKGGDTDATATETFRIGTKGLAVNTSYFVDITGGLVGFSGATANIKDYYTDKTQAVFTHISANKVMGVSIQSDQTPIVRGSLRFEVENIKLGRGANGKEIEIGVTETRLNSGTVRVADTVLYGEKMQYDQVSNGYDLYVN